MKIKQIAIILIFLSVLAISATIAPSMRGDAVLLKGQYAAHPALGLLAAPSTPANPNPPDGATNVVTGQILSWQGGDPDGDPITYTVAVGTVDPPPVVFTTTHSLYQPGLISNTIYYWQITATDGFSTTVGPVWQFTTGADAARLYLPIIFGRPPADAIIVDHRHTDISQIPDYWIEQAKLFAVHYAHTSHGGQILSGLNWLENRDAKYNVAIQASGPVVLPGDTTALRFYDGNNYSGDTYITPEQYWASTDGINHTRSVADTGWFDFSLWTWCGQMSDYNTTQVQNYLDVMAQFETEYPAMRFIYYTGHTDGDPPGSTLWQNNELVRQYAQNNNKVLFDFADIESYDPAGNFYPTVSDACQWCSGWCAAHPTNFECQSLPPCSHSHGLQCTLKAQAFWWLMARLAGWDGTP